MPVACAACVEIEIRSRGAVRLALGFVQVCSLGTPGTERIACGRPGHKPLRPCGARRCGMRPARLSRGHRRAKPPRCARNALAVRGGGADDKSLSGATRCDGVRNALILIVCRRELTCRAYVAPGIVGSGGACGEAHAGGARGG